MPILSLVCNKGRALAVWRIRVIQESFRLAVSFRALVKDQSTTIVSLYLYFLGPPLHCSN